MRIFRTMMLLTGVTVFMPSPPGGDGQIDVQQAGAEISTPGLIGNATMAFADVASFCARQPDVCRTAGYVAGKLEAKAKYSVRLIYEWASESSGQPQASSLGNQADASDPITTGSTVLAKLNDGGQSTLRLEDLIPAWRGPVAHKKS
jgi:hypothetical protein